MIELLTGVPGSGKTYFAVDRLSKEYAKKSRPIFTNINLLIPFDDVLQPLDIKDFHEFCKKEMEFFEHFRTQQSELSKNREEFGEYATDYIDDEQNSSSNNYDEVLKASGLLDKYGNALILWDECHNDLDVRDPAYVRWMSYHRHFEGMDVLLITQNLSLIDRKYKGFIDQYYFGIQAAKRLFSSTFKYKVYTDHKQYEKFLIDTISLPSSNKIFALYDSGFYKVNKSAAFKKLAPIFVLIVFIALFTKYVLFGIVLGGNKRDDAHIETGYPIANDPYREEMPKDGRTVEEMKQDALSDNADLMPPPPLETASNDPQSPNFGQPQSFNDQSSLARHFVRFQCTNTYCYFSQNRFTIPISTLERFFEEFNGKILSAEILNKDISIVTALVPSELYYMIESHNIVSRSDNYDPQSQKNSFGSTNITAPQFSPSPGV